MSKDTLYWLGTGVLTIKDDMGKPVDIEYGDIIPEGVLDTKRLKKLMGDGVIGERPVPQKASETARLKNIIKEQKERISAMSAGEDGKRLKDLEEKVTGLTEENEKLKAENEDLSLKNLEMEETLEGLRKETEDLTKALEKTDKKGDKGGVGAKS